MFMTTYNETAATITVRNARELDVPLAVFAVKETKPHVTAYYDGKFAFCATDLSGLRNMCKGAVRDGCVPLLPNPRAGRVESDIYKKLRPRVDPSRTKKNSIGHGCTLLTDQNGKQITKAVSLDEKDREFCDYNSTHDGVECSFVDASKAWQFAYSGRYLQ